MKYYTVRERPHNVCRIRPQDVGSGRLMVFHIGQYGGHPQDVRLGRPQDAIIQRPKDVGRGRPQDVSRGRPFALHRGTYGYVHRTSFGDVLGI